jgi:hypothetical protein
MIALRFRPREEWEARLRQYQCVPVAGLGRLNTAEWWRARWNFLFTIPVEDDGSCHEQAFQSVVAKVVASAPSNTVFDC